MEYIVLWAINVDAEDERGAAKEALRIMRDRKSTATVFDVIEAHPDVWTWYEDFVSDNMITIDLGSYND